MRQLQWSAQVLSPRGPSALAGTRARDEHGNRSRRCRVRTQPASSVGPSRHAARDLRRAWVAVALLPVALVLAMLVGEGLISALGYQSGSQQPVPIGPVLLASVPALLILVAPGVAAVYYGRRARLDRRGDCGRGGRAERPGLPRRTVRRAPRRWPPGGAGRRRHRGEGRRHPLLVHGLHPVAPGAAGRHRPGHRRPDGRNTRGDRWTATAAVDRGQRAWRVAGPVRRPSPAWRPSRSRILPSRGSLGVQQHPATHPSRTPRLAACLPSEVQVALLLIPLSAPSARTRSSTLRVETPCR